MVLVTTMNKLATPALFVAAEQALPLQWSQILLLLLVQWGGGGRPGQGLSRAIFASQSVLVCFQCSINFTYAMKAILKTAQFIFF